MAYHVRRSDRAIKDPEILEQIITQGKYATIALCKDNEPYIVTLSYGYDGINKYLYFHGAKKGRKIDFVKANSKAYLTIIDDKGFIENECDHSYMSVVIKGEITILKNEKQRVDAIRVLIDHFEKNPERMMRKVNTDTQMWLDTVIFKFQIQEITGKEKKLKVK